MVLSRCDVQSDVLSLMVLLANLQIHCMNELRKSTLHQEILWILQKNHDGMLSHKMNLINYSVKSVQQYVYKMK